MLIGKLNIKGRLNNRFQTAFFDWILEVLKLIQ